MLQGLCSSRIERWINFGNIPEFPAQPDINVGEGGNCSPLGS